jgi:hypothetical protein
MNWKKPSPKPSVSSLQTTQKPGSITASMVYSKTENALVAFSATLSGGICDCAVVSGSPVTPPE